MRHAPVWIAVFVAVAIGVGVALYERSREPLVLRSGTALPEPRALPAFALVDQAGRPFGLARFEGGGACCSRVSRTAPMSARRRSH